jgi:3-hydroxyacyl-[acyl-carrier-protein] dehydratase
VGSTARRPAREHAGVPIDPTVTASLPPIPADAVTADRYVALLPHRPPFRFVDVVDECEPGVSIVARYRVTGEEAFLAGHFPGEPVFPGVIQVEALAQSGAIAVLADPRFTGRLLLFGGIEGTRFRRVVRPGDELVFSATLERLGARGGWCAAKATVDGDVTCEARLFMAVAPAR